MSHHVRREPHAVVALADAFVISAAKKLVDWLAMAVGGIKIAQRIKAQAKGIGLTPGELLDAADVDFHAKRVAGVERDARSVARDDGRSVVEIVGRIKPAVEPATKGVDHAMRVVGADFSAEQRLHAVGFAVAIIIVESPDFRNAVPDGAALKRVDSDRNVQTICKG